MWVEEGYKPGCWCSRSWARTRSWGISSFRMESFSNPASSSMPKPTLCWAWCLLGRFLPNIDSFFGWRAGEWIWNVFYGWPLCSFLFWDPVALVPETLLGSVTCWLPAMGTWASSSSLQFAKSRNTRPFTFPLAKECWHLLSAIVSIPVLFDLVFIACQFSYCDKCILYESRNECGFSTPMFNPR